MRKKNIFDLVSQAFNFDSVIKFRYGINQLKYDFIHDTETKSDKASYIYF